MRIDRMCDLIDKKLDRIADILQKKVITIRGTGKWKGVLLKYLKKINKK